VKRPLEAISDVKATWLYDTFLYRLTLAEASKLTPYTQEYLSLLARRGSLGAFKLRRNWVITKKTLNEYLKAHPRNPP